MTTHLAANRYSNRRTGAERAYTACGREVEDSAAASHPHKTTCKSCLRTDHAHAYTDWRGSRHYRN